MKFESLFNHVADAVLLARPDGQVLRANPVACALLGRSEEQLQQIASTDLVVDASEARIFKADPSRASVLSGELTLRHANGELIPVEYTSTVIPVEDGPQSCVIFRDVRERKAVERELADARARLDAFMEASPALKWVKDADGRLLFVNPAWQRTYGRALADVRGMREHDLRPLDNTDDIEAIENDVMSSGQPHTSVEAHRVSSDSNVRWYQTVRFRITDRHGTRLLGGVASEMTAQKHAEDALRVSEARARQAQHDLEHALDVTRRTEEKFRQSQKMEAVGRLAGGIAHDFNNLLTVILGNCEALAERLEHDPLREEVESIEQASQRAATLTRQLLAFSRKQVLEPRVLNLNTVLLSLETMFRRLLGEDIVLAFLLHSAPYKCLLDPGQMEQVVLNLVVNARDAMPDGGRLTIETANVVLDDTYVRQHPEATIGPHLMLSVSDTGTGMSRDVQAHLFEPFFTTKPKGRGTGLGLSTVYGIVKQSGGTVWVYSEPGQGSTFKLYFPETTGPEQHPPRRVMSAGEYAGTETILLVEDDSHVRATIASMLRRVGYRIIEATNGGEALLICEDMSNEIDVLLTDIVMPKMNGRQLAERLRVVRPSLRVVFMSGYTENVVVHHGVVDSGVDFLQKPLVSDALLPKIREVLDRSPEPTPPPTPGASTL